MTKPAIPTEPFAEWPRVTVDQQDGSDFAEILRIGAFAADEWTLSTDGPYKRPQPPAGISRCQIREALLHLLELGFLDIDTERLHAADWIPMDRRATP